MENTVIISLNDYHDLIAIEKKYDALVKDDTIKAFASFNLTYYDYGYKLLHIYNADETIKELVGLNIKMKEEIDVNIKTIKELKSVQYKWWFKLFSRL